MVNLFQGKTQKAHRQAGALCNLYVMSLILFKPNNLLKFFIDIILRLSNAKKSCYMMPYSALTTSSIQFFIALPTIGKATSCFPFGQLSLKGCA